jgi:ERF superfamily
MASVTPEADARKAAAEARKAAEEAAEHAAAAPDGSSYNLVGALAAAQAEFPAIPKSKTATVRIAEAKGGGSYSYKYADISDVLAAVRPILAKHHLAVIQRTKYADGGRLLLLTELKHVSGDVELSEVELKADPSNPQQFGGSITYLRRYELVTLLGIAAEEDTDAQHVDPAPASSYGQPPKPPAWAKDADRDLKRAAVDSLERVFGDRNMARDYCTALAKVADGMPVAVAKWIAVLPEWIGAAGREGMLAEVTPPAPAEAAKQDAAAERPDPPSPEGDAQIAPDTPIDGGPLATEPEDAEAAEAEAARHVVQRAEELGAELPRDADGVVLAPGTAEGPNLVDVAKLDGHAKRVAAFRDYGCICPDPVSPQGVADDLCPIVNHGIPF